MLTPKLSWLCWKKTLEIAFFLFLLPTVGGSNCSDTSSDDNDDCDDKSSPWTVLMISLWGIPIVVWILLLTYGILNKYTLYKKRLSQSRSNKQANIVEVPSSTNVYSISDLSSDSPSHAQLGGIYYKPDFSTPTHAQYGGIRYGLPVSTPTHAKYGGFQYGQLPSTPTHAQYGGFTYSPDPSAKDTTETENFWKGVFKDFI